MLFMITYAFSPDVRDAAQDRFRKTGGLPGPGAKMLGRWHDLGGHRGFLLAESNDSVAIGKWIQEWSDLLEFEVTAVNTDEDIMKVLNA
ncbi:MAG TPA: DUF3303 family protein [Vicinamibacterales bacterium]|nr:DUF3303 family protein [Vicinamibacterales bacterium]